MKARKALLALTLAALFPIASSAAVDVFLKLDGIKGESTDDRHKDEIVIESWSLGATNTGSHSVGGGGGAGKPTGGGDLPLESISLNFSSLKMSYRPQNADGSTGAPVETNVSSKC